MLESSLKTVVPIAALWLLWQLVLLLLHWEDFMEHWRLHRRGAIFWVKGADELKAVKPKSFIMALYYSVRQTLGNLE